MAREDTPENKNKKPEIFKNQTREKMSVYILYTLLYYFNEGVCLKSPPTYLKLSKCVCDGESEYFTSTSTCI